MVSALAAATSAFLILSVICSFGYSPSHDVLPSQPSIGANSHRTTSPDVSRIGPPD